MTYGFDDVTFTSIGTGVAETQLNSGTSLSAPDPAHAFNAVIPYQMELGAFTTNQSLLTAFRIQSDDVAVEPKKFVLPNKTQRKLKSQLSGCVFWLQIH